MAEDERWWFEREEKEWREKRGGRREDDQQPVDEEEEEEEEETEDGALPGELSRRWAVAVSMCCGSSCCRCARRPHGVINVFS